MKWMLAVLLMVHGIAHSVGFASAWKLLPDPANKNTLFFGQLHFGDNGMRAVGILWLVGALAFVSAAVAIIVHGSQNWWVAVLGVSIFSLLLCLAELPEAKIGLGVNIVIIAGLLAAKELDWPL